MSFERRRAPRYQLIAEAEITEPASRRSYKARTSDVSLVGCFMNTTNALPAGTKIQVRVTHCDHTFSTKAKVERCEPAMGIGISFDDLKGDQRALLQGWLTDFSSNSRAVVG
jgi:hypothetical protein